MYLIECKESSALSSSRGTFDLIAGLQEEDGRKVAHGTSVLGLLGAEVIDGFSATVTTPETAVISVVVAVVTDTFEVGFTLVQVGAEKLSTLDVVTGEESESSFSTIVKQIFTIS